MKHLAFIALAALVLAGCQETTPPDETGQPELAFGVPGRPENVPPDDPGRGLIDPDNDGVPTPVDNCPNDANGVGDVCDCVAPPSGLVSWWPGDGNANDIIGGQVTALKNGAGFASGKVGQAFSLDGVDDYVSIINTINLPRNYSVTGWFKTTAPALVQAIFAATRPEGHGILVELRASGLMRFLHRFPLGGTGGTNIFSLPATTRYDDGVFHYFVAAKAGAIMSLHVDGVPVGTASDASVFPTTLNQIVLGQLFEVASVRNWVGLLDEVSVYNRALSLAEIQAIFNAGSEGKCKP